MSPAAWVATTTSTLAATGLQAWGIADGHAYDAILPGCRSVLVVGGGGTALWEAFTSAVRREPHRLTQPDPLDAFVAEQIAALPGRPGQRWVLCTLHATPFVDFRALGHAAGLGWSSRLGLLLHPTYGPWLSLRAACFTTEVLPPTGPLRPASPCQRCPAPCATACPAQAVDPNGFDIQRCVGHQAHTTPCRPGCHARQACPQGAAHAYGPIQHSYHQHATGRRGVLAALSQDPSV